MKISYLISFILLIIININAQPNTSYNKIVNNIKVASTVPLIAWGSKVINIYPILNVNLPSNMSIVFANINLNDALSTWSAEGNYTKE